MGAGAGKRDAGAASVDNGLTLSLSSVVAGQWISGRQRCKRTGHPGRNRVFHGTDAPQQTRPCQGWLGHSMTPRIFVADGQCVFSRS